MAAPKSNMLPRNNSGFSWAERGSITATTPSVARASEVTRSGVIFSLSNSAAKTSTKAGVAEVTREPFAAVDNLVPRNCRLNEIPYPTKPTPSTCQYCFREMLGKPRIRRTTASVSAPSKRRIDTNVNGGMISSTTLLTTYMPPQMDAAPSPQRIPTRVLLIRRRLYLESTSLDVEEPT